MGYASIPTVLTGYSKIGNGSFAGNNTVNRGIPHGLGTTVKQVTLQYEADGRMFFMVRSGYISMVENTINPTFSVTAGDSTNFYVGNAGNYAHSGNAAGVTYHWTAMG